MKIKQLIQGIPDLIVKGSKEVEITGLSNDSNTIVPGNLFIARKGLRFDGAEFIPRAIDSGASAILGVAYNPFFRQTQILCRDPAALEAMLASRFYHHPSKKLFVVGVTGTKGKTTTSYLIHHLLEKLHRPAGLSGTIEMVIGKKRCPSTLTTQDAIRNQKSLSEMLFANCKAAVMEVSSHGLEQNRVDCIDFDLALFTNLYPDHLDYHRDLDHYAAAKKRLFHQAKSSLFNADSPFANFMMKGVKGTTFGCKEGADIQALDISLVGEKTVFTVCHKGIKETFSSPLMGRFNVYNLLGAIAVGLHLGASLSALASIFAEDIVIAGRLEPIKTELGFSVFVDFAHSGASLENVLSTLREITKNRLIVIFGCGGGRDPMRRPEMAAAAEKWADLAIVTSDNPRHEDPAEICRQILAGFQQMEKVTLEIDRREAIALGMQWAREGDVVLIAGKGHERTQIFGSQTAPFDDRLVAKEALQILNRSAILS